MMLMKGECLNNFKSPDMGCCTIKPLSQQYAAEWFCVSYLPQQANDVYGLKIEISISNELWMDNGHSWKSYQ